MENYFGSELVCKAEERHPDVLELKGDDTSIQVQTPWGYQYRLLATRNFLNVIRLPQTSYVKLTTTCVTATFVAFFFWQAGASHFVNEYGPYCELGCPRGETTGQYY